MEINLRLASFQKPTIAIGFNLLQVCPSVFAALLIPSKNVFSGYFHVSRNLVVFLDCYKFQKIHDTAPLTKERNRITFTTYDKIQIHVDDLPHSKTRAVKNGAK